MEESEDDWSSSVFASSHLMRSFKETMETLKNEDKLSEDQVAMFLSLFHERISSSLAFHSPEDCEFEVGGLMKSLNVDGFRKRVEVEGGEVRERVDGNTINYWSPSSLKLVLNCVREARRKRKKKEADDVF